MDTVSNNVKQRESSFDHVPAEIVQYIMRFCEDNNLLRFAAVNKWCRANALESKLLQPIIQRALKSRIGRGCDVDTGDELKTICRLFDYLDTAQQLDVCKNSSMLCMALTSYKPQAASKTLKIINTFPEKDRVEILKSQQKLYSSTALHLAVEHHPKIASKMLEMIPDQCLCEFLQMRGKDGETVLHMVQKSDYHDLTVQIQKTIPALTNREQFEILKVFWQNCFFDAVLWADSSRMEWYVVAMLIMMNNLLDENQRFEILKERNKHNDTALHWCIKHFPSLVTKILKLYICA